MAKIKLMLVSESQSGTSLATVSGLITRRGSLNTSLKMLSSCGISSCIRIGTVDEAVERRIVLGDPVEPLDGAGLVGAGFIGTEQLEAQALVVIGNHLVLGGGNIGAGDPRDAPRPALLHQRIEHSLFHAAFQHPAAHEPGVHFERRAIGPAY